MKQNEAKKVIEHVYSHKDNSNKKVLKAMALGIAMALATTSVPMTAMAAEGDENTKESEETKPEEKSESEKKMDDDVSEAKEKTEETQTKLDESATESGDQHSDTEETIDMEKVSDASDMLIGTSNPSVAQEAMDSQKKTSDETVSGGTPSDQENSGEKKDEEAEKQQIITVDDKINELESDYETIKEEYEEANQVVVDKSEHLTAAEESYQSAKDRLQQVQSVYTEAGIAADTNEVLEAISNSQKNTASSEDVKEAETTLSNSQPIDVTSSEYLNMLETYKQTMISNKIEIEEVNAQIAYYHQAVLDYNASLLNYHKTYEEYHEAAESASTAFDKLVDTENTLKDMSDQQNKEELSDTDKEYADQLGNLLLAGDKLETAQKEYAQITSTKNLLQEFVTAAADTSTELNKSLSTYFSLHATSSLDSEGPNWANNHGNDNVKLEHTINESVASSLGIGVDELRANYIWKITKNDDEYTVYLAMKESVNNGAQLVCSQTTTGEDVTVNWIPAGNKNVDGSVVIQALNLDKAGAYYGWETPGEDSWLKLYDDHKEMFSEADEDTVHIANILSTAMTSQQGDLYNAINSYFSNYLNTKKTLDSSGKVWANGDGSGALKNGSINDLIAATVNKNLPEGSTELSGSDINDSFVWCIERNKDGSYVIYVTDKTKTGSDNTPVYMIDSQGKSYVGEVVSQAVNAANNNGVNITPSTSNCVETTAEKVNSIVSGYQESIQNIIQSSVAGLQTSASKLMELQAALHNIINAENKSVSDAEYKEAVQTALDRANEYIDALEQESKTENLAQNIQQTQNSSNEGTIIGNTETTITVTTATGTTATNRNTAIITTQNLASDLQNILNQPTAFTAIDETVTPLAAVPEASEDAAVLQDAATYGTVMIHDEKTPLSDGSGISGNSRITVTISSSTTLEDTDVSGITTIDDGDVALSGKIENGEVELDTNMTGDAVLTNVKTSSMHKGFFWWIILAIGGLFGAGFAGKKYIIAGKKDDNDEEEEDK